MEKEKSSQIEKAYDQYKKIVRYEAARYLKDADLVQDAVQETALKLVKNFDRFSDMEESHKKYYVKKIARYTAIDIFNREVARLSDNISIDEIETVADEKMCITSGNQIIGDQVDDYIEDLSTQDRDIIVLTYGFGLTYGETAVLLGIKETAVRKRASRAREKIRNEMIKDLKNGWRAVGGRKIDIYEPEYQECIEQRTDTFIATAVFKIQKQELEEAEG